MLAMDPIKSASVLKTLVKRIKAAYEADGYDPDTDTYSWGASRGSSLLGGQVGDFSRLAAQKPKHLGRAVQQELLAAYSRLHDMESAFNKDFGPYGIYSTLNAGYDSSGGASADALARVIRNIPPEVWKKLKSRRLSRTEQMEGGYDSDRVVDLEPLEQVGISLPDLYESGVHITGVKALQKALERKYGKRFKQLQKLEATDDEIASDISNVTSPINYLYDDAARQDLLKYLKKL
jgi:hypothetical protein